MIAITSECKMCPTKETVNVTEADYAAYTTGGQLVQNVWPKLHISAMRDNYGGL